MDERQDMEEIRQTLARLNERLYGVEGRLAALERGTSKPSPATASSPHAPRPEFPGQAPNPSTSLPPVQEQAEPQTPPPLILVPPAQAQATPPQPTPVRPPDRYVDSQLAAQLVSEESRQTSPTPNSPSAASPQNIPLPPPLPQGPTLGEKLRGWLEMIHMWPPSGGGSFEVQLGAWWLTRLGALLAVICAVFFGFYVAQNTPAWIRFCELTAASVALTLGGRWIERRYGSFGAAVVGAGLGMIYFTSFAAYALEGVKIIDSPLAAIALQYAVLLGILADTLFYRKSKPLATMTMACGYISAIFSAWVGQEELALAAALLLGAAGAGFYVLRAWNSPFKVCVALAYVLYAYILQARWISGQTLPPEMFAGLLPLVAQLVLFGGADLWAALKDRLMPANPRRWVQIFNSAAALGLGYWATRHLWPAQLDTFYFVMASVLLAGAAAFWRLLPTDLMLSNYTLKGTAMLSMGVITAFEGRTRWIALGIQSAVWLAGARRTHRPLMQWLTGLVWLASVYYFLRDLTPLHPPATAQDSSYFLSIPGALGVLYVAGSALVLGLRARWIEQEQAVNPNIPVFVAPMSLVFYSVLLAVAGVALVRAHWPAPHLIFGLTLLMAAVGAVFAAGRLKLPLVAAGLGLLYAHVQFWGTHRGEFGALLVWLQAAALLAPAWAGAWAYEHWMWKNKPLRGTPAALAGAVAVHGLWILAGLTAANLTLPQYGLMGLAAVAALALAALASLGGALALADLSLLPWLVGLGIFFHYPPNLLRLFVRSQRGDTPHWWWVVAAAAVVWIVLTCGWRPVRRRVRAMHRWALYQIIHLSVAMILLALAIDANCGKNTAPLVWSACAVALLVLVRWPGVRPALLMPAFFSLIAMGKLLIWCNPTRLANPAFVGMSTLAMLLILAYPVAAGRLYPAINPRLRTALGWVMGLGALLMLDLLGTLQRVGLQDYATVFWGAGAIVIFLVGLADRYSALRWVGLTGLALCLPRMFLVDLDNAFQRIIAFGLVGAVMLGVGFLYNKYQTRIDQPDRRQTS